MLADASPDPKMDQDDPYVVLLKTPASVPAISVVPLEVRLRIERFVNPALAIVHDPPLSVERYTPESVAAKNTVSMKQIVRTAGLGVFRPIHDAPWLVVE